MNLGILSGKGQPYGGKKAENNSIRRNLRPLCLEGVALCKRKKLHSNKGKRLKQKRGTTCTGEKGMFLEGLRRPSGFALGESPEQKVEGGVSVNCDPSIWAKYEFDTLGKEGGGFDRKKTTNRRGKTEPQNSGAKSWGRGGGNCLGVYTWRTIIGKKRTVVLKKKKKKKNNCKPQPEV